MYLTQIGFVSAVSVHGKKTFHVNVHANEGLPRKLKRPFVPKEEAAGKDEAKHN